MIDPLGRWEDGEKPDYAGLADLRRAALHRGPGRARRASTSRSSGRRPTTWSRDRPGTRFGPRAIRAASSPPGAHLEAGDRRASRRCAMVDYGDAPVVPADPARSHAAIERTVGEVRRGRSGADRARRRPLDRRARRPRLRRAPRPASASSTSTPTPTPAREVFGVEVSHGTPMYRLVEQGHVDPGALRRRSACAATGRASRSSPGRPSAGSRASSCTTCASTGSARSSSAPLEVAGERPGLPLGRRRRPRPGVRARHRHPEPGGMTPADLLWACRAAAAELEIVGAEVVEVIPTRRRLGRHHRAGRRPDRARDRHRESRCARPGRTAEQSAPANMERWRRRR